jgi:hypothetical protein
MQLLREKMLRQDFDSRVVALASSAHRYADKAFDPEDLHFRLNKKYSPIVAYGNSKVSNILFAKELADQLVDSKICCVSVHPGVIRTNLVRNIAKGVVFDFVFNSFIVDKDIPQGASTTLYACFEPTLNEKQNRGSFLSDCAITTPNDLGQDASGLTRTALWKSTEMQISQALAAMDEVVGGTTEGESTKVDPDGWEVVGKKNKKVDKR